MTSNFRRLHSHHRNHRLLRRSPHGIHPTPLEASGGGGGGGRGAQLEMLLLGGPPLPLSLPAHPSPHRRLHRPHSQAPPLLPRPPPPPLPPQMPPHLTSSHPFSSSATAPSPPDLDAEAARVSAVIAELFDSDRNMEAVLSCSDVHLSPPLLLAVLDRFRHAHKPSYRFFRWAATQPEFSHTAQTYNKMLSILGKTRQFETMVAVLAEMEQKRCLDMETLKVAVTAFAAAREMKKAVAVLKTMEKCKVEVGIEGFNSLLFVLANEGLGREAQEVFDRMRDRYTADIRTYTVLLSGWCKVKNLVEAGKVWNEMVDVGIKPDIVTHNVMIDGLLRGQRRPEAIKLYELMKAKGPRPSTCTYNILIEDLRKHGKMERAVACFEEMVADGCVPDAKTYTSLIVGFGDAKQLGDVSALLREMTERGCPPDGHTYNALIKLLTNRNMPDDALKVYKRMVKSGIAPTVHTFNMMMKSYFRANNYEMGSGVWEEMSSRGVCPDDNSYTVLIGGLIRQGRSEEALNYIEEMINKGMKAPIFDYNKFAADFARVGRPDVLYELAEKMSFSGKSVASGVFMGLAERMQKGAWRKHSSETGR